MTPISFSWALSSGIVLALRDSAVSTGAVSGATSGAASVGAGASVGASASGVFFLRPRSLLLRACSKTVLRFSNVSRSAGVVSGFIMESSKPFIYSIINSGSRIPNDSVSGSAITTGASPVAVRTCSSTASCAV